jgi:hypothetical protein
LFLAFVLSWPGLLFAQRWLGGESGFTDEPAHTAREVASHSTVTPVWTNRRFVWD